MTKSFPQRKSPRLRDYNYSQSGAYFVTICTNQRRHLFGAVDAGVMHCGRLGQIAEYELQLIPQRWRHIDLDLFVIMPNHIHAIIIISDRENVGTAFLPSAETPSKQPILGHVIGNYKAGVTRLAHQQQLIKASELIWQMRFHDHIIRNEAGLNHIRDYVLHNPELWQQDKFYSGE